MVEQEFSPELITLSDDEGTDYTFELLDLLEEEENRYVAMLPVHDDPQEDIDDPGSLVIMKLCEEDGEEFFEEIQDEADFDRVADIFVNRLQDVFDFEE